MVDDETLERRLRAVERALTDGDAEYGTNDAGAVAERTQRLESELEDVRDRIADLEAATQALRGYVGNVRSVNEDVERRADAALAAVERLERERDESRPANGPRRRPARTSANSPPDPPRGSGPTAAPDGQSEPPETGTRGGSEGASGRSEERGLRERIRDAVR